jgi:hypothetical protein
MIGAYTAVMTSICWEKKFSSMRSRQITNQMTAVDPSPHRGSEGPLQFSTGFACWLLQPFETHRIMKPVPIGADMASDVVKSACSMRASVRTELVVSAASSDPGPTLGPTMLDRA